MSNTRDLVFLCEICDFQGGSHQNLMYHSIMQHHLKVFACRYCDHVCKDKYKTVRHTRNQHQDEVQKEKLQEGRLVDYSTEITIIPAESEQLLCYFEASSTNSYNCMLCDGILHDKSDFANHLCSHHSPAHFIYKDPDACLLKNKLSNNCHFVCKLCRSSSLDFGLLAEHIFVFHSFNIFSDKINPNVGPISLKKHQKHSRGHKHKCHFCLFSSFFSKNLKKHMAQHGANMKFKCTVCNFSTDYEMILTKHKRYFHSEPQLQPEEASITPRWVCPVCKLKRYYNRKSLMNHWRTKHREETSNERPFHCYNNIEDDSQRLDVDINNQNHSSIHPSHLNNHQHYNNTQDIQSNLHSLNNTLQHLRDNSTLNKKVQETTQADDKHTRSYKCPFCQRNMQGWSEYISHKRTHATKVVGNRLKCARCPFLTSSLKYLKQHQARHLRRNQGEEATRINSTSPFKSRPGFKCEFCPFFAKNLGRMQMHLNCHRKLCKHQCGLCSYSCHNQAFLRKHSNVHSPEYVTKFYCVQGS